MTGNTGKPWVVVFCTLAVCMILSAAFGLLFGQKPSHTADEEPYTRYKVICIGGYKFADNRGNYQQVPPNQILNSEGKGIPCETTNE